MHSARCILVTFYSKIASYFPRAKDVLSNLDINDIGTEMAARRGLYKNALDSDAAYPVE